MSCAGETDCDRFRRCRPVGYEGGKRRSKPALETRSMSMEHDASMEHEITHVISNRKVCQSVRNSDAMPKQQILAPRDTTTTFDAWTAGPSAIGGGTSISGEMRQSSASALRGKLMNSHAFFKNMSASGVSTGQASVFWRLHMVNQQG